MLAEFGRMQESCSQRFSARQPQPTSSMCRVIRQWASRSTAVGSGVMSIASQDRRCWPFALLIVCFTAGCSRQNPAQTEEVRPVKTMVVGAGDASYVRYFPGRAAAAKAVDLAFLVPGLVTRVRTEL